MPGLDIHCGIWKALEAAGIRADANAGTSAGAFVAALNSAGTMQHGAEHLLRNLSDEDVIRKRFAWQLRIRRAESMCLPEPIIKLCYDMLPGDFRDLEKPLSIHATHELTGNPQELRAGCLPLAVAASMALSGVWPPVNTISPHGPFTALSSDGGTTENLPLPAMLQEYDEIWLLVAKRPLAYPERQTILSRMFWNAHLLLEHQVRETISTARRIHKRVFVIRPDVESPRGTLHFDHTLIDQAAACAALQIRRYLRGWEHGNG